MPARPATMTEYTAFQGRPISGTVVHCMLDTAKA